MRDASWQMRAYTGAGSVMPKSKSLARAGLIWLGASGAFGALMACSDESGGSGGADPSGGAGVTGRSGAGVAGEMSAGDTGSNGDVEALAGAGSGGNDVRGGDNGGRDNDGTGGGRDDGGRDNGGRDNGGAGGGGAGADAIGGESPEISGAGMSATGGAPPLMIPKLAVATGNGHTCVNLKGRVKCWGDNDSGRLGIGSTEDSLVPVAVRSLSAGTAVVDAGLYNTCALSAAGVQCWGRSAAIFPTSGDALVPKPIAAFASVPSAIALGVYHLCALVDGTVQCVGSNQYGQLGAAPPIMFSRTPLTVAGLEGEVSAVTSGRDYSCAIVSGAARCWGQNNVGQLGDGTKVNRTQPVQVQGLESGVTAIGASSSTDVHTCALADGEVYCWGNGTMGQLGNGEKLDSPLPVKVSGLGGKASAIAVGGFHACALVDGKVWCWGWNQDGQLGNDATTNSAVPVAVRGLPAHVEAIDTDGRHGCAIADGLYCWGDNDYGQLGIGTTDDERTAVKVDLGE